MFGGRASVYGLPVAEAVAFGAAVAEGVAFVPVGVTFGFAPGTNGKPAAGVKSFILSATSVLDGGAGTGAFVLVVAAAVAVAVAVGLGLAGVVKNAESNGGLVAVGVADGAAAAVPAPPSGLPGRAAGRAGRASPVS